MGLYFNHYVILGVDIKAKRKEVMWGDKFLPFIEGHYDVEYRIIDNRGTHDFMYFGLVLAQGDHYEGLPNCEIKTENIEELKEKVIQEYIKAFEEDCDKTKVKMVACTVIS